MHPGHSVFLVSYTSFYLYCFSCPDSRMAPKRLLKKSGGTSRRGASTRTRDKETSKKTSRSKKQDKMEVSATRRQFVS